MPPFGILANHKIKMCHNSMKKIMIQKITQNNWNFWTVNLIMGAKKIVNQSSDFLVRRTGSYSHKKALPLFLTTAFSLSLHWTDDILQSGQRNWSPRFPIPKMTFECRQCLRFWDGINSCSHNAPNVFNRRQIWQIWRPISKVEYTCLIFVLLQIILCAVRF